MKILREGPPWNRRQECIQCLSLLLLEEEDVKYIKETVNSVDDEEIEQQYYYFACAKCSTRNRLDASELPSHVTRDAYEDFQRGEIYNLG
jgi:hypothetical protein